MSPVTVRLWAGVKEAAGTEVLEVEGATVAAARDAVAAKLPAIAPRLKYCRFALDDAFVPPKPPCLPAPPST